jgi:hypothetical protein
VLTVVVPFEACNRMFNDPETARAYAGLIAASSVVAAKRAIRRPPGPGVISRGIRLPSVQDIPHLFEATHDSTRIEHRLWRIVAASLLYTAERKTGGYAEQVLAPRERGILHAVHHSRDYGPKWKDRRCRYCQLSGELYDFDYRYHNASAVAPTPPRFLVVGHSATVQPNFDPNTFVSSAEITNYRVLVPGDVAIEMVSRSHPLSWKDAAPTLFLLSDPAHEVDHEWVLAPDISRAAWEVAAREKAYIYERVVWPLSADSMSQIDNAIRISGFDQAKTDSLYSLSYDYALQSCLDSDFAIVRESGGLDVDDGNYSGRALDVRGIVDSRQPLDDLLDDLGGLTQRDLDLLDEEPGKVSVDTPNSPPLRPKELLHKAIPKLRSKAIELGGHDPWWLVTISASKKLRFTAPGNTPADLWGALAWMAPSLVFTFVYQAVCQAAAELTAEKPAASPAARYGSGVPGHGDRDESVPIAS